MRPLAREFRHATRALSRRPFLSLVAVTSIALGIAFNAVIFSAINALLLEPVPGVQSGDRAVEIGRTVAGRGFDTFGYVDYQALRDGVAPLAEVAAWRSRPLSWGTDDGGERLVGMTVSPGYFTALGVTAARGRLFGSEEDRRGGPAVAVVSHRFWQERLGGDPDVVGRTLELSRTPFTVMGVTAPGFEGHVPFIPVDIWTPIARSELADPTFEVSYYDRSDAVWLHLVGRLREDATVERANAAAAAVMAQLAEAYPRSHEQRGARIIELGPVPGGGRAMAGGFLGILMGLVGLILLITASNVAGMLLARAADRRKEIGIRLAMGAGRTRLVRMLTAESLVLFLVGGVIGTGLAFAGARVLSGIPLPGPEPFRVDISADPTVLAFALALAALTGIIFGLVPGLQASRPDLVSALHADGRGGSRTGRLRRWLAAGQVAVAVVLLVAAGLFLRALQSAGRIDAGFDPEAVTVATLDLALEGYDDVSGPMIQQRILDQVRATPGVDGAALALDLPLDLASHGNPSYPEGWDAEAEPVSTEFNIVSDGFFETLDIPVLQGRGFTAADRDGAPLVAVVNRAMAERAWPGEQVVGKRLRFRAPDAPLRTVVGVVANVKNQTLGEIVDPMVYLPTGQHYASGINVLAAGPAGPGVLRNAILEADPRLAIGTPQRLDAVAGLGILPQRIAATLATALGGLALFLSVLGVYGVIAHSVTARRRELGIRKAVGATQAGVVRLVLWSGVRMVLPGVVIGVLAAIGLGQVIRSLLFGVSPADAATLGAVVLIMAGAVVLATGLPSVRASRLDPMDALRAE